jgi:hypothetical protein
VASTLKNPLIGNDQRVFLYIRYPPRRAQGIVQIAAL